MAHQPHGEPVLTESFTPTAHCEVSRESVRRPKGRLGFQPERLFGSGTPEQLYIGVVRDLTRVAAGCSALFGFFSRRKRACIALL